MKQTEVSIIIATLNVAAHLERTLLSICRQELDCIEILIVDGGSKDGTTAVIDKYLRKIKWTISEPDCGIYDAWNKAVPHATGKWICFLGAGDTFASTRSLNELMPHLQDVEKKGGRFVYGRTYLVNEVGERLDCYGKPWSLIKSHWLRSGFGLCHTGLFHHASLFKKRCFDSSFKIVGDYEFLLPVLGHEDAVFVEIDLTTWQIGGVSSNPSRRLRVLYELARAREKHGLKSKNTIWYFEYAKAAFQVAVIGIFGAKVGAALTSLYRQLSGRTAI